MTKMEDGLYFNWRGKTHRAGWDGSYSVEGHDGKDWRLETPIQNISAKNIKLKEH